MNTVLRLCTEIYNCTLIWPCRRKSTICHLHLKGNYSPVWLLRPKRLHPTSFHPIRNCTIKITVLPTKNSRLVNTNLHISKPRRRRAELWLSVKACIVLNGASYIENRLNFKQTRPQLRVSEHSVCCPYVNDHRPVVTQTNLFPASESQTVFSHSQLARKRLNWRKQGNATHDRSVFDEISFTLFVAMF